MSHVPVLCAVAPIFWFCLKVTICVFGFIWVRFTLPRLRWDQLMRLGWVVLLPASLTWVAVVAVVQGLALAVAGPGRMAPSADPLDVARVLLALLAAAAGIIVYLRRAQPVAAAA